MDGCEVLSMSCEGTVGIIDGEVWQDGEKLNLTDDEVKTLWQEYLEGEGVVHELK